MRGLTALLVALALAGCTSKPAASTGGDAANGRLLLRQFGCGHCHRIPGVADAEGNAGPALAGVRHRAYLGGVVPNSAENMARWIREPKRFDPRTAMPDLGVGEAHARDMVAYLWTLE